MNLVMNAVKYAARGGGQITLSSAHARDVAFHVIDRGPAFP